MKDYQQIQMIIENVTFDESEKDTIIKFLRKIEFPFMVQLNVVNVGSSEKTMTAYHFFFEIIGEEFPPSFLEKNEDHFINIFSNYYKMIHHRKNNPFDLIIGLKLLKALHEVIVDIENEAKNKNAESKEIILYKIAERDRDPLVIPINCGFLSVSEKGDIHIVPIFKEPEMEKVKCTITTPTTLFKVGFPYLIHDKSRSLEESVNLETVVLCILCQTKKIFLYIDDNGIEYYNPEEQLRNGEVEIYEIQSVQ